MVPISISFNKILNIALCYAILKVEEKTFSSHENKRQNPNN